MGRDSERGFTIIELMLFAAITSLLTVLLMTGWSLAINTQSYKDSLNSFASKLREQFTDSANVINDRSSNFTCNRNGNTVTVAKPTPPQNGQSRGVTDCVIMGRSISIEGGTLTINSIVGAPPTTEPGTNELDVIRSYQPTRIDNSVIPDEKYDIPWSASTHVPGQPGPLKMYLAIIRSPSTGAIYTYSTDPSNSSANPPTVGMLVSGTPSATQRTICVDPGAAVAQGTTGVVIAAHAASESAISVANAEGGSGC